MTDFQKLVYNTHLRVSRSVKGQPYKLRADFSDFENDKNYVAVMKLSNFFASHSSVNMNLFFKAPYEIYGKAETFYLDFYLTSKAAKAYSLYLNQVKDADPDSPNQLEFIIASAKFVKQYCQDNNVEVEDYTHHCPDAMPIYLQHLLQCNISIYFLLAFRGFASDLHAFDKELVRFMHGEDFYDKLERYRLNYFKSEKAKILAIKSLEKISKISVTLPVSGVN